MRRRITTLIILFCTFCPPGFAAENQSEPVESLFLIRWENDALFKADMNYTNGVSFALSRTDAGVLGGLWDLGGTAAGKKSTVYELTQLQFTPAQLDQSPPDPDDRPYAGITYLACTTHLQQAQSLQSLKLMLGVVGPASGAEEVQKAAHRPLNQSIPQGWPFQLKNEPIVNLLYEYRYRYRLTPWNNSLTVDIIPMGGAFLGNYLTQAQAEMFFRIGSRLRDNFGASSLRDLGYLPQPRLDAAGALWGISAYLRGGANLVARNITLDGNTFAISRSVEKRNYVPFMEIGTEFWTRWFMTTVSYQIWGREFDSQQAQKGFGSILLSFPL